MKYCAILLLVCLMASVTDGGIIKTAISLACDGLVPILTIVLDTLISTITGLLSGLLGAINSLPIVGGVVNGLNLNQVLTTVTAALGVRTALVGAVCGPTGLLAQVEAALCESSGCLPGFTGCKCDIPKPTACPSDFKYVREVNGCYKFLTARANFDQQVAICKAFHPAAYIAIITSKEENDAVAAISRSLLTEGFYWIGLHRKERANCASMELVWDDVNTCDPIPMTYSKWCCTHEPRCLQSETCVVLEPYSSDWFSFPCVDTWYAVCEVTL